MLYIVDANFFITAYRSTYPPDVFPGFWDKINQLAATGVIKSIDKVKDEINNEWLKNWFSALPNNFFLSTAGLHTTYPIVVQWAFSRSDHFLQKALDEFMDSREADAFLIATALEDIPNRILVTQEVSQPERKNKIKIPEGCIALGVNYMNTVKMFRDLGVTL